MTSREQRIGLLGCGAIGRGLALAVDEGKVPGAVLVALFDQDESAARSLAQRLKGSPKPVSSFDDIAAAEDVDMVVEAASQEAVRRYGEAALSHGKDLLIMSTGALLDGGLLSRLAALADEKDCRVFAPSGAVGGIDAIRAARDELEEVTLTTRKPPGTLVDVTATFQTSGRGGHVCPGGLRGKRPGSGEALPIQHQCRISAQPGRDRAGADQGADHRRPGGPGQHPRDIRAGQERDPPIHNGERATPGQSHDQPPGAAVRH